MMITSPDGTRTGLLRVADDGSFRLGIMHTIEGKKLKMHHNGDFSGDVHLVDKKSGRSFEAPFADLKLLVSEYVRTERVIRLENLKTDEILLG